MQRSRVRAWVDRCVSADAGATGRRVAAGLLVWLVVLAALPLRSGAQPASGRAAPAASGPESPVTERPGAIRAADPRPLLQPVPAVFERLRAADIGLVINQRDPYSVAVGAYYAQQRGLAPEQILRVDLPVQRSLSAAELGLLQQRIDEHFGFRAQALALAWVMPYAVGCHSLNGALALGYDEELCRNSCAASQVNRYANSRSGRPYSDFRLRLSMHLAARSVEEAQALIDRGVQADGQLRAGAASLAEAPAQAYFVSTTDRARNVRAALFPGPGRDAFGPVRVKRVQGLAQVDGARLIFVSVGIAELSGLPLRGWLPGALADHLTSVGGDLLGSHGQGTAWQWTAAGATASHGAVSEPCNHLHKFPHPQWLLGHYVQGSTAIEAYWKSVMWPQQSLFVGEPLAAPFADIVPPPRP